MSHVKINKKKTYKQTHIKTKKTSAPNIQIEVTSQKFEQ